MKNSLIIGVFIFIAILNFPCDAFLQKTIYIELGGGTLRPDIEIEIESIPGAGMQYSDGMEVFELQENDNAFGYMDGYGDDDQGGPLNMGIEILSEIDQLSLFAQTVIESVQENMKMQSNDPNIVREVEILEGVQNLVHNMRSSEQVVLGGLNLFSDITSQMDYYEDQQQLLDQQSKQSTVIITPIENQQIIENSTYSNDDYNQEIEQVNTNVEQQTTQDSEEYENFIEDYNDKQEEEGNNKQSKKIKDVRYYNGDETGDVIQQEQNNDQNPQQPDSNQENTKSTEFLKKESTQETKINVAEAQDSNTSQFDYQILMVCLGGLSVLSFLFFQRQALGLGSQNNRNNNWNDSHPPDEYQAALNDRMRID